MRYTVKVPGLAILATAFLSLAVLSACNYLPSERSYSKTEIDAALASIANTTGRTNGLALTEAISNPSLATALKLELLANKVDRLGSAISSVPSPATGQAGLVLGLLGLALHGSGKVRALWGPKTKSDKGTPKPD